MVHLTKEIINVMKKLHKVLEKSEFKINKFECFETGAGGEALQIDIRRHEEIKNE